jgi:hypothetical protein
VNVYERLGSLLSKGTSWDAKLALLRAFITEHGRLPRYNECYQGAGLGVWIYLQQKLKRQGVLNLSRQTELETIPGWSWKNVARYAPPIRADKRALVEGCGYAFLGQEQIKDNSGRLRLKLHVSCPQGHTQYVLWDNFKPIGGTPRKGCAKCHHARVGEHRRIDITPRLLKYGLEILDTYTANSERYRWRCLRQGHLFVSSLAALENKAKSSGSVCTQCNIDALCAEFSLECLTPWTGKENGGTAELQWVCQRCGSVFRLGIIQIQRRAQAKNKACPQCP